MKRIILLSAIVLMSSCSKQNPVMFNLQDGWYSIDLESTATSGWAGGVDSDTSFYDVGLIATDFGTLYTLNTDTEVTPLPILGFNFLETFKFAVSMNDTALQIGTETWYKSRVSSQNGASVFYFTRITDYNGMGKDIQTLILTEQ